MHIFNLFISKINVGKKCCDPEWTFLDSRLQLTTRTGGQGGRYFKDHPFRAKQSLVSFYFKRGITLTTPLSSAELEKMLIFFQMKPQICTKNLNICIGLKTFFS